MSEVSLSFKDKPVLKNLTFTVGKGEIFGLLGPSGAGKTSTIKLLTRQLTKNAGKISLFGRDIEHVSDKDYERIGILSDMSNLYDRMSLEENLIFYARLRGVSSKSVSSLLKRMKLYGDRKTLFKKCSRGMKQRAVLLAALIHSPELVFLDEPTAGLDPVAKAEVHEMLYELNSSGTTVFLATHDMNEAENLCNHIGILNEGSLIACGAPDLLRLSFARNIVKIRTKNHAVVETTKDTRAISVISQLLEDDDCLSIHSEEPSLEEVFINLTGRKF